MNPERKLENKVRKWAEARGIITLKLNMRGMRGWPDRLFIKDGVAYFIEFKTASGKVSLIQQHVFERLARAGMGVAVVSSFEAAKIVLFCIFKKIKVNP